MKAADLTAAGKFKMDRPWPDLLSRIIETGKFGSEDKRTSLLIVGFATEQAKNIDVWERTIGVTSSASIQEASASLLLQWLKQGEGLIPGLVRSVKSPNEKAVPRKHKEIPPMVAAIRPHVENKVFKNVGELISIDDNGWEQAAREYRPMMEMIAKSLSPAFTVSAFQRRQQIAHVTPDMRPKTGSTRKPGQKKEGDK